MSPKRPARASIDTSTTRARPVPEARAMGRAAPAALLLSLAACGVQIQGGGDAGGGSGGEGGRTTNVTTSAAPAGAWEIAAAGDNTCVLSPAGHVACWGSNETGQLGLGDFVDRKTPTWIPGLEGVVEIAMADFTTCARKADSGVWCWGMNAYAELGATTPTCNQLGYPCSAVPVLAEVGDVARMGAGTHHVCAVTTAGGLECWGAFPSPDAAGYRVQSVTAGYSHTCARFDPAPGEDPSRNVVCFGKNAEGELGTGNVQSFSTTPIVGGPAGGFTEIASGMDFTCGVSAGQEVLCWGQNVFGALGLGVPTDLPYPEECPGDGACAKRPVAVPGLPPSAHVAAHYEQACALAIDGTVRCWGTPSRTSPASALACFQANPECTPSPTLVPGVASAKAIAVGLGHACALDAGDQVSCWGLDTHGQLGRGEGPEFETMAVGVVLPPEPN